MTSPFTETRGRDDLAPARGVMWGLVLSAPFWLLLWVAL